MSWCNGKTYCEIYRNKVYCNRGNRSDNGKLCDCRHAKYLCQVEYCKTIESLCPGPVDMAHEMVQDAGRSN